jgi:hypothetical protein
MRVDETMRRELEKLKNDTDEVEKTKICTV